MKRFLLYSLIILFSISCSYDSGNVIEEDYSIDTTENLIGISDCGISPYTMYGDVLFKDSSTMYQAKIRFIYIKSEEEPEKIKSAYISQFIEVLNKDYYSSNISFVDGGSIVIEVEDEDVDIMNIKDHGKVFSKKGYINCFIYPSTIGGYPGIAGGIPSTFFGIKEFYMQSRFTTGTHELGHLFGLLHPHTYDSSGLNNSYTGGDLICSTHATIDRNSRGYLNKVDNDCNYTGELGGLTLEQHNKELRNFMAYSQCRAEFDSEQIDRMHFIINNSQDLKKCFTVI